MDAKQIVEQLLSEDAPITLDFTVQNVNFDLNKNELYGRGESPSIDEIKAQQRTTWRLINMAVRKTGVQISDLAPEFHDEVENDYQIGIVGKVTGTEEQLRSFAQFGIGSNPDNRLWYVTQSNGDEL